MSRAKGLALLSLIAVLAVPAVSSARGGAGGGGAVTPPPAPNANPCASVVSTKPTQTIKRNGSATLSYNVTNCSGAAETVNLVQSGHGEFSRPDTTPQDYTCDAAPATAATLTLKAGETKGLSVPAPPTTSVTPSTLGACLIGATNHWTYTGAIVDPAGGTSLASADSVVLIDLSF